MIKEQTILLTKEEVEANTFFHKGDNQFYTFLEKKIRGINTDEPEHMDCREIEIADNIQDFWWNYAEKELGAQGYEIGMALVMSGPKVNKDLPNNTVWISDKFFCLESEE